MSEVLTMGNDKATSTNDGQPAESGRGRSTVDVPYFDLDNAIMVAEAVHAVGGTGCDWTQLAVRMKQTASGGGFRMRVMTARSFGLLTYDRGSVTLSDLGIRVVDPKFARIARADSFLAVPLFKLVYEKLKGSMIPPAAAIERQMESLGVAPKSKEKARQVFMRSAKQAGFFELDLNHLTYPPISNGSAAPSTATFEPKPETSSMGGGGGDDGLHPFIKGLLEKLPEPETEWPVQSRVKWLQTAANIFDLMYTADEQGKSVNVSLNDV